MHSDCALLLTTLASIGPAHRPRSRRIVRRVASHAVFGATLVVAFAACSSDKDPDAPDSKGALTVDAGECLFVDSTVGAEVSKLPVIECTKAHTHEIFAKIDGIESDVYPGLTALETYAEQECYGPAFTDFVGISPFDSALFITWIVPSLDGWNDEDDRTVLCILGRRDGAQLETSAKGLKL